ncbi:hypothetical protein BC941DRAFT_199254 [Chlamydoabsidia padenii]|nr:hypothetical protein BC941DRAFT_199254 [Chlamydoabsidia padenii]
METLNLESASELGLMYESVLKTHTISQPSLFKQQRVAAKQQIQGIKKVFRSNHIDNTTSQYDDAYALSDTTPPNPTETVDDVWGRNSQQNMSTTSFDHASTMESITINGKKDISSSAMYLDYQEQQSSAHQNNTRDSSATDNEEERHIVLVRQLDTDKDRHRFMTQGYRFADTAFIANTMSSKLCVPNDYLLGHFRDMHLLAKSSTSLEGPASPRVMVGLLGLIDEGQAYNGAQMVVDKHSRYGFPLVDLIYNDTGEPLRHLLPEEKQCLYDIFDNEPLNHMTDMDKYIDLQPRPSLVMGPSSTNTLQTLNASTIDSAGYTSTSTTIKTSSSITNPNDDLISMNHYHLKQEQHTQNFSSTVSPSSSQHTTVSNTNKVSIVTQRFAKAMEMASKKLVNAIGANGLHLGLSGATLQAEVLDLPSFALTTGPCTLILFRICLRTRGLVAAIQQHASTEPIRCIPCPLGLSLAHAITQRAVDQYQKTTMAQSSWADELKQQILYGNFAPLSTPTYYYKQQNGDDQLGTNDYHSSNNNNNNMYHNHSGGASSNDNSGTNSKHSSIRLDMMTSLPPPPRVKRIRQPVSVDVSEKQPSAFTTNKYLSLNEMESSLVILPAKDRFMWWDQVIVECMHSNSS